MKILTSNDIQNNIYTTIISIEECTDNEKIALINYPDTIKYSDLSLADKKVKIESGHAVISEDGITIPFILPNKEVEVTPTMKLTYEVSVSDVSEITEDETTFTTDDVCAALCKIFEAAVIEKLKKIKATNQQRTSGFEGSYTTEF